MDMLLGDDRNVSARGGTAEGRYRAELVPGGCRPGRAPRDAIQARSETVTEWAVNDSDDAFIAATIDIPGSARVSDLPAQLCAARLRRRRRWRARTSARPARRQFAAIIGVSRRNLFLSGQQWWLPHRHASCGAHQCERHR
jgi:hypothetical protein